MHHCGQKILEKCVNDTFTLRCDSNFECLNSSVNESKLDGFSTLTVLTTVFENKADYPGGGHFNVICTGVCGHRIGKLTHPQTKAVPKTDPFSDYLQ